MAILRNFFLVLPTFLSGILLGAHFLRRGSLPLAIVAAAFPLLLLVRHRITFRGVQIFLGFAAARWLLTTYKIAIMRVGSGQTWIRMAVILGAVAAFAILAAFLLERASVKSWLTRFPGKASRDR